MSSIYELIEHTIKDIDNIHSISSYLIGLELFALGQEIANFSSNSGYHVKECLS